MKKRRVFQPIASWPLILFAACLGCACTGTVNGADESTPFEPSEFSQDGGEDGSSTDQFQPSCPSDGDPAGSDENLANRPLGDLTGPWQLFLDDFLIENKTGVVRKYHAFEKYASNPIMKATKAWEDTYVYLYGRVMPNENGPGYRMWYSVMDFHDTSNSSRVLYATSADGLNWEKPSLGIRSWSGNSNNNFFIPRDRPNHIMSVLHTPWDPDPNCKYKFINFDGSYQSLPGGYDAACSADGLHLVDLTSNPVFNAGGDVGQFLWDPWNQQYLGYVKIPATVQGKKRRAVGQVATKNFGSWPASATLVLAPDEIDDFWVTKAGLSIDSNRTHFYGMSVFPYQTMYLGLLWIFRSSDPPNCGNDCEPEHGYIFGTIHIEIASSRDGTLWTREDGDLQNGRPPMLPLGPSGSWDSMMLFTANPPLLEGNQIKLYYGGCDEDHGRLNKGGSASVGLAYLRKDGFASLDTGATTGTITTKKLSGAKGNLRLNYQTAAGGFIKVEVQNESGQPVPGYAESDCTPLQGDQIDQAASWGSKTELPSSPCVLRLKFILQNASLYSYQAGNLLLVVP